MAMPASSRPNLPVTSLVFASSVPRPAPRFGSSLRQVAEDMAKHIVEGLRGPGAWLSSGIRRYARKRSSRCTYADRLEPAHPHSMAPTTVRTQFHTPRTFQGQL